MIDNETRWTLDRLHQDVNDLRAWTSAADARAEDLQHEVCGGSWVVGGGGRGGGGGGERRERVTEKEHRRHHHYHRRHCHRHICLTDMASHT